MAASADILLAIRNEGAMQIRNGDKVLAKVLFQIAATLGNENAVYNLAGVELKEGNHEAAQHWCSVYADLAGEMDHTCMIQDTLGYTG